MFMARGSTPRSTEYDPDVLGEGVFIGFVPTEEIQNGELRVLFAMKRFEVSPQDLPGTADGRAEYYRRDLGSIKHLFDGLRALAQPNRRRIK